MADAVKPLLPDRAGPVPDGAEALPLFGGEDFPRAERWLRERNPRDEFGIPFTEGLEALQRAGDGVVIVNLAGTGPGRVAARRLAVWRPAEIVAGVAAFCRIAGLARSHILLPWHPESGIALDDAATAWAGRGGIEVLCSRAGEHPLLGEPTAAIEVLEGNLGIPRPKPIDPFSWGFSGRPAWVWGPETAARAGRAARTGVEPTGARRLVTLLGDVGRPGVYERADGVPLGDLLRDASARDWGTCLVGGLGGDAYLPEEAGTPLSDDVWRRVAGPRSEAVVVVLPASGCPAGWTLSVAKSFFLASCGQCPPCRDGTNRIAGLAQRIERDGARGREHLLALRRLAGEMRDKGNCPVASDLSRVVRGLTGRLEARWDRHLRTGQCGD